VSSFVFTDSMNGCAYAITGVDGDAAKFEAWHFQSETDNFDQASHFRATKGIRDWFGVNDYYVGDGEKNSVATNIIWHSAEDGWKMLSQKNILPLDDTGKVEPKGTSVHDLNVDAPMEEEQLDEVHGKLKQGALGGINAKEIAKANTGLAGLVVPPTKTMQSLSQIKEQVKSMSGAEATEITKISSQSADAKLRRDSDVTDFSIFADVAGLKAELDAITTKGLFGPSYDETKTQLMKTRFRQVSSKLLSDVMVLAAEAASTTITNEAGQVGADATLLSKLRKVQFFFDVYQDIPMYEKVYDLGNEVVRIVSRKTGVQNKFNMLAAEKTKLYPA
jgi:hypothetical protein